MRGFTNLCRASRPSLNNGEYPAQVLDREGLYYFAPSAYASQIVPAIESIIAGFLVVAVLASIISRRINVPYTQFLVLLGVLLASFSVSSIFGVDVIFNTLVGNGYFVALILPPLLFEAMMNIRSTELRSIINPALTLATAGVLISTVVAGLALWTLAGIPLSTAFVFGALIAPTDTATVLEIFKRVKVPTKLSALLETEAGFNDATG